jgi:hypothetical protein
VTDLSREAVTAAVQIADLTHLLKHHALQALRDANRQLHDAAETIGRLLEARSASMQERIAVIDALGLVATTLTLGASTIDLQACNCTQAERAPAPEVSPEQQAVIERDYVERPRGKVIDLGVRLKQREWSTGGPR